MEKDEKPVAIALDCDIDEAITVEAVQSPPESVNSFAQPLNVSPRTSVVYCGAREFVYQVPPYSASVLIMKKR